MMASCLHRSRKAPMFHDFAPNATRGPRLMSRRRAPSLRTRHQRPSGCLSRERCGGCVLATRRSGPRAFDDRVAVMVASAARSRPGWRLAGPRGHGSESATAGCGRGRSGHQVSRSSGPARGLGGPRVGPAQADAESESELGREHGREHARSLAGPSGHAPHMRPTAPWRTVPAWHGQAAPLECKEHPNSSTGTSS